MWEPWDRVPGDGRNKSVPVSVLQARGAFKLPVLRPWPGRHLPHGRGPGKDGSWSRTRGRVFPGGRSWPPGLHSERVEEAVCPEAPCVGVWTLSRRQRADLRGEGPGGPRRAVGGAGRVPHPRMEQVRCGWRRLGRRGLGPVWDTSREAAVLPGKRHCQSAKCPPEVLVPLSPLWEGGRGGLIARSMNN